MITPWAFYQLSCSFILLGNILILIYYIYMTITRKMFRYYTVSKKTPSPCICKAPGSQIDSRSVSFQSVRRLSPASHVDPAGPVSDREGWWEDSRCPRGVDSPPSWPGWSSRTPGSRSPPPPRRVAPAC